MWSTSSAGVRTPAAAQCRQNGSFISCSIRASFHHLQLYNLRHSCACSLRSGVALASLRCLLQYAPSRTNAGHPACLHGLGVCLCMAISQPPFQTKLYSRNYSHYCGSPVYATCVKYPEQKNKGRMYFRPLPGVLFFCIFHVLEHATHIFIYCCCPCTLPATPQ